MAAEQEHSGTHPESGDSGLTDDVCSTNKVQKQGGSYTVSIPKDSARELGIGKGDTVVFVGQEGEESLQLQTAESFLAKRKNNR